MVDHQLSSDLVRALREARRALRAIYLEVPSADAADLHLKIEAAFVAYDKEIARLLAEPSKRSWVRSAISGRFVRKGQDRKHPRTTTKETK